MALISTMVLFIMTSDDHSLDVSLIRQSIHPNKFFVLCVEPRLHFTQLAHFVTPENLLENVPIPGRTGFTGNEKALPEMQLRRKIHLIKRSPRHEIKKRPQQNDIDTMELCIAQ